MSAQSIGHVTVINGYEYFTYANGDLYMALISNPLDVNGYRMGARWELPKWMVDSGKAAEYLDRIRAVYEPA